MEMQKLAKESYKDSKSMRILSFVALIYLPATLILVSIHIQGSEDTKTNTTSLFLRIDRVYSALVSSSRRILRMIPQNHISNSRANSGGFLPWQCHSYSSQRAVQWHGASGRTEETMQNSRSTLPQMDDVVVRYSPHLF